MKSRKIHEYLRHLWLKEEINEFSKVLKTLDNPAETLFGLIAYYIENKIENLEDAIPFIKHYEKELITELPRLVDNEGFLFLNWDIWIEPVVKRTVYVTDPVGASTRAFVWFLIYFEKISKIDEFDAPKSLEIGEKRFLDSLNTIKQRYDIDETHIINVAEKIQQWSKIRKTEFSKRLMKMKIDTSRFDELKLQILSGFKDALFQDRIFKTVKSSIESDLEYRKFDTTLNVPKALLVEKASQYTEYGMFGAGKPLGKSIAEGINQYIIDTIKKTQAHKIEFNIVLDRIKSGEKMVCNPKIWLKTVPMSTIEITRENAYMNRKLKNNEIILFPTILGNLFIKKDLTITLVEENHIDEIFDEPMVLINIKIVFSFREDEDARYLKIVDTSSILE